MQLIGEDGNIQLCEENGRDLSVLWSKDDTWYSWTLVPDSVQDVHKQDEPRWFVSDAHNLDKAQQPKETIAIRFNTDIQASIFRKYHKHNANVASNVAIANVNNNNNNNNNDNYDVDSHTPLHSGRTPGNFNGMSPSMESQPTIHVMSPSGTLQLAIVGKDTSQKALANVNSNINDNVNVNDYDNNRLQQNSNNSNRSRSHNSTTSKYTNNSNNSINKMYNSDRGIVSDTSDRDDRDNTDDRDDRDDRGVRGNRFFGNNNNNSDYNKAEKMKMNVKMKNVVKNVLVIILGIGEYDKNMFENFIGVTKDYFNILHCFSKCHRFDCIYFNKQNKLIQTNIESQIVDWDIEFKLRWTCDEIDYFKRKIFDFIQLCNFDPKNCTYDGFIFFISSHGGPLNIIYDSKGDKYELDSIFDHFDNENCANLRNKPKLYIIDTCRGKMGIERVTSKSAVVIGTKEMIASKSDDYDYSDQDHSNNNEHQIQQQQQQHKIQNNNNSERHVNGNGTGRGLLPTAAQLAEAEIESDTEIIDGSTVFGSNPRSADEITIVISKEETEAESQTEDEKEQSRNDKNNGDDVYNSDEKDNSRAGAEAIGRNNNRKIVKKVHFDLESDDKKLDGNLKQRKKKRFSNEQGYLKDSHCRKIFGCINIKKNYVGIDNNKKGGYLIQSIVKVLSNPNVFENYNLDLIIESTRQLLNNLIGNINGNSNSSEERSRRRSSNRNVQVIKDINTMPENIWFESRRNKNNNNNNNNGNNGNNDGKDDNNNSDDSKKDIPIDGRGFSYALMREMHSITEKTMQTLLEQQNVIRKQESDQLKQEILGLNDRIGALHLHHYSKISKQGGSGGGGGNNVDDRKDNMNYTWSSHQLQKINAFKKEINTMKCDNTLLQLENDNLNRELAHLSGILNKFGLSQYIDEKIKVSQNVMESMEVEISKKHVMKQFKLMNNSQGSVRIFIDCNRYFMVCSCITVVLISVLIAFIVILLQQQ